MDPKGPPKAAVILATPINVEESRAQRLQRQQSRFRDRGGIFVPSSRSTLANILLGKASPLKKNPRRSRSRSVSPCKAKSHAKVGKDASIDLDPSTIKPISRRSPQKQARKSTHGTQAIQPKPIARKSTCAPKDSGIPIQDLPIAPPPTKTSKAPVPKNKSKTKSKTGTSNHGHAEGASHEDDEPAKPVTKLNSKSKTPSAAGHSAGRTIGAKELPQTVATTTISKGSRSISSPTTAESSKPARPKPRKSSDLYSGGSEDEYVPKKPSKPRKSTAKAKATAPAKAVASSSSSSKTMGKTAVPAKGKKTDDGRLSDIAEEDEEEDERPVRPISVPKKPAVAQASTKQDKKGKKRAPPDDDLDVNTGPSKKRSKKSVNEPEPIAKLKPETQKETTRPPKKPRKKTEPEKEDDEVVKKSSAKAKKTAKAKDTESKPVTKSRKKSAKTPALEEETVEDPPPNQPSTKRARDEPEETSAEKEKPAKRKKTSDEGPKSSKTMAKSTQSKNTTSKSKSSSAHEAVHPVTKVSKSQKSSSAPVGRVGRTGPPKSVLQRIQNSQLDELDNEPDPIDFLS